MTIMSRDGKLYLRYLQEGKITRRSLKMDDTAKNRKIVQNEIIPKLQYEQYLSKDPIPKVPKKQRTSLLNTYAKKSFEIHAGERNSFTYKGYIQIYNLHIKPYFGSMRIDEIKTSDILLWQNTLLEKLSSKTLTLIKSVFNSIFTDCINDEIITKNPLKLVKSPKHKETREKKPFTKDEIFTILKHSKVSMRCFFAIAFFTGLRTGEIIGLKWDDIDWEERIIKIRRRIRQGVEDVPKTKNSIRDIEIIDVLMPYLVEHRENTRKESEYVFETRYKRPYGSSDKITQYYWRNILNELGIPYRHLYTCRHTFASMMIANGEDILWVSNMLGHRDSSMTLQVYSRYIPKQKSNRGKFLIES
jgi:integrase